MRHEIALTQLMNHALALHQAGRVDEAEPIYRQVLAADADNEDIGIFAHAEQPFVTSLIGETGA
jgi:thioredoxin-like negative regulator of GroEL